MAGIRAHSLDAPYRHVLYYGYHDCCRQAGFARKALGPWAMKKRAEIRSIDCDGVFLEDWNPGREWDFAIQITIEIGLNGDEGGWLFYLEILPRLFFERCPLPRFTNRALVLDNYDPRLVKEFINRVASGYEFENWEKCVEHFQYYFSHEYENYKIYCPRSDA